MTLPTDLSNLLFWYKADAITGLSDGDSITTWPDSSGNGYDISTVSGTAPTWHTSVKNSLPAVLFGGAGLLKLPSGALGAFQNKGAGMVYVVINETDNSNGSADILRASCATVGPGRFTWEHTSNQAQIGGRRLDSDSFVQYNDATFATSTWYVESGYIDWADNASGSRQNGGDWTTHTSMFTSGAGNTSNTASNVIDIGGNSSSSNTYLTGYIAEIFCFDRLLTDTEQAEMDSYLSDRYGITVTDYVSSDTDVSGTDSGALTSTDTTSATVPTTDSGTFSASSSVAGTTQVTGTDSETLSSTSSLVVSTSDSAALADITNDILISDSTADATLSEVSSLGNTPIAKTDSFTLTDSSTSSATPAAADSGLFSDASNVAVLGTSPTTADAFTFTDIALVDTSTAVDVSDFANLADVSFLVEAGGARDGRGVVTIISPRGVVTFEQELV